MISLPVIYLKLGHFPVKIGLIMQCSIYYIFEAGVPSYAFFAFIWQNIDGIIGLTLVNEIGRASCRERV